MQRIKVTLLVVMMFLMTSLKAHDGMWLPIVLKNHTFKEMQKAGFKLTPKDIYDINNACLKDAVVGLGRAGSPFHHFCTAELISDQGLLITNHHCGYSAIQQHSSVEHDYLTDGFWAYSKDQELANPWMTASFLRKMEDVTKYVLKGIDDNTSEKVRDSIIKVNSKKIIDSIENSSAYRASIKQFFAGNEYYVSVYEIYKDIRLVGAPPSAIGKFGGDTDNWSWPRHTGDFSMFRIYASKDNKPAEYNENNVPYKPLKHFKVSLKGIKANDFTMVLGYPGTTQEYIPSYQVDMVRNHTNPIKIDLRTIRLQIMDKYMQKDKTVRIQYSSKYAGIANGWKKWIGENIGLDRFKTIENKQILEKQFSNWSQNSDKYSKVLPAYKDVFSKLSKQSEAIYNIYEGPLSIELLKFASQFNNLVKKSKNNSGDEYKKEIARLKTSSRTFFKDYYLPIDKDIALQLLTKYSNSVDAKYQPEYFKKINRKYKGNFKKYINKLYDKSIFCSKVKVDEFLDNYSTKDVKKVEKDPAYKLFTSIYKIYRSKVLAPYFVLNAKLKKLNRLYIAGLREMDSTLVRYPDANSSFRVAFGKVQGFTPKDGVEYGYQTTLKGIIEKDNPEIYDYRVPAKLKELYTKHDYGRYANSKGELPVCFLGTNHTTGGNSGSPVLDAYGNLIGINFDRAWEGVMSDITYNPVICRNIMLDIRYALFIIDKYAGAQNLINEIDFAE